MGRGYKVNKITDKVYSRKGEGKTPSLSEHAFCCAPLTVRLHLIVSRSVPSLVNLES